MSDADWERGDDTPLVGGLIVKLGVMLFPIIEQIGALRCFLFIW